MLTIALNQNIDMKIGKAIGLLIKRKGLTQVYVAARVGKSTTAINQIIKGNYYPTQQTLERICEVLEVPLPVLIFLSISEDDVPEGKRELFKMLYPSMEYFIAKIFGSKNTDLIKYQPWEKYL